MSPIKISLLCAFTCLFVYADAQINRSYNGESNNLNNPSWGAAHSHFKNFASNGYADSISAPGGLNRPNARTVSNALGSQQTFMPNELGLSDFVWGWGQFIDHDINLNDDNTAAPSDVQVPSCDTMFDPNCAGNVMIRMFRSKHDTSTGKATGDPRRHLNDITSYIDASNVYGSDAARSDWLRTFTDGKMKTSAGNLLPWNTIDGEYSSAIDPTAPFIVLDGHPLPDKYFVGGDIRVNEQPTLIAFHTLFVREHNRLCDKLKQENPSWNDEELFQRARKMVGALIQVVTYEEFLPMTGIPISPYSSYDNTVDASIMNSFSAAAFRFGHTMVNGRLMRYEEDGQLWSFGVKDLRDGFFKPTLIKDEGGIEPFFRGLAAQTHQMVDPLIMDDLRNFLFGMPGAGGIDLLTINIARARERGVPDYNTLREDLGLSPHVDVQSLTSDVSLQNKLSSVYTDIDDVDPWIGLMSEDHLPNSIMGEGLATILGMQFTNLRDGDRYYYENDPAFSLAEIAELKATTLSQIILRNAAIDTLQPNVFKATPRDQLMVNLVPFANIKNIELTAYPNPIQRYFNLVIEATRPSTATLNIWDMNGKQVKQQIVSLTTGRNELNFELDDELASGVYTITLQADEGIGKLRVSKVR